MGPRQPAESGRNGMPNGFFRWAALLAASAYVGLSLVIPSAAPVVPPALDASLVERLFPGVPAIWVVGRITAIVVAIIGGALAARGQWTTGVFPPVPSPRPLPAPAYVHVGLAWTLGLVLCSFGMRWLPRPYHLAYLAALPVPVLLLYLGQRGKRAAVAAIPAARRPPWLMVFAVVATWLAIRLPGVEHAPAIATALDAHVPFRGLQATLLPDYPLLTGTQIPGFTALLSILQGPLLCGISAGELTPWVMQRGQIFWAVVTALGLAVVTAQSWGRYVAPVAAAVFLFSPAVAMTTLFLGALFLGPLVAMSLTWLWLRLQRQGEMWAVAAFGSVAGACLTHPSLAPIGLTSLGFLLGRAWLQPQRRSIEIRFGLLCFLAVALPGLPGPSAVQVLVTSSSHSAQMWAGIDAVALGQVPQLLMDSLGRAGRPERFDVALGMVLSPWLTPRTMIRFWGDSWFEPVGAALCALGIGACLGNVHRSGAARALLTFFVLTLVPGLVSSYDRPSLTRALALPCTIALLASVGAAWGMMGMRPRMQKWLAGSLAALAWLGGFYLFDVVRPRILGASPLALAIEATDAESTCRAAIFLTLPEDPFSEKTFAENVPRCRLRTVEIQRLEAHLAPPHRQSRVYFSPGFEDHDAVAARICRLRPQARIFAIRDAAGLGSTFVAALSADDWVPPLDASRWRRFACGDTLPTEKSTTEAALRDLRARIEPDQVGARIEALRATAAPTFVQHDLYLELSQFLMQRAQHPADGREAVYWTARAAAVYRGSDTRYVRTRIDALRATRQDPSSDEIIAGTLRILRSAKLEPEAEQIERWLMEAATTSTTQP